MALEDMDVTEPPSRDELLPEIVEAPLEEALGRLEIVLETRPLTLLRDGDTPTEVVLARPGDMLDTEALIDIDIDIEMLLLVNVELPRGGEVNGWLDEDTVDSGYGPMSLELDAVAEPAVDEAAPLLLLLEAVLGPMDAVVEVTVGDGAPLLLEAELDPPDAVVELIVGDPTPLLLLDAELDPRDDVAELTVDEPTPLLLLESELDPATLELLDVTETVVIAEELVLVTENVVVVVVTTFPA